MRSRFLPLLVLSAVVVLAAACGEQDASPTATDPAVAATTATEGDAAGPAAAGEFNDADVLFAQSMIPHHEQAIEMAEIALDPAAAAGPEVVDLATRIRDAQDPEVQQMTEWLEAWGQPLQMDTGDGHDMSSMDGVMSAEEMDALAASSGEEFDQMWLAMMIEHHQGAITMAETQLAEGANPDALALAEQVIAAQQAEIAEMEALLA